MVVGRSAVACSIPASVAHSRATAFRLPAAVVVGGAAGLRGASRWAGYLLVGRTCRPLVAHVVDTNYLVVANLSKSVLRGAVASGGVHAVLSTG